MAGDATHGGPIVVITLPGAVGELAEVQGILAQLGIPCEIVSADGPVPEPGTVMLRVPPERLVEAVLALTDHGFPGIRAYGPSGAASPADLPPRP